MVKKASAVAAVHRELALRNAPFTGLITFSKQGRDDPNDPAFRDIIVPGYIELTRGTDGGLYNHAQESQYDFVNFVSPLSTLWALGTLAEKDSLLFEVFDEALGSRVGQLIKTSPLVMQYFLDGAEYFAEFNFAVWDNAENGAAVQYTRTPFEA